MIIEACVDSVRGAVVAEQAGISRIELNCALELDGLTPPLGLLQRVRAHVKIPIICMVRSRAGNFCYSQDDWLTMNNEVSWLIDHGADGLAFGALDADGKLDIDRCQAFAENARHRKSDCELVFHKAFDVASDWRVTMDSLVDIGFDRIMTSGQSPTAVAGLDELRQMFQYAAGRTEILPAGGVRSHNAAQIVRETGCSQVHGSFRKSLGEFSREVEQDFGAEIAATVTALS